MIPTPLLIVPITVIIMPGKPGVGIFSWEDIRPILPTQQGPYNPKIRCFRYGEQGHRAANCKKPPSQQGKNLLIKEEENIDTREELMYNDEATEDVLYGDGYETLVGKNLLIKEEENIDTREELMYNDEATEDVLYGDGYETLVVRQILLTPKVDSGDD
ncbi:hypothetical protein SADUNF_Sadunf16G0070100 [Salix dunnii]|uniref:CCHC-type domain-containing protein n=1 Tax=Salix dunnii TaxID=1413687 RepID=A0A835J7G5_9ROSI|nr:hypothetical protein SADUNF_Sadunf16G0070100 [Salix dunnii]